MKLRGPDWIRRHGGFAVFCVFSALSLVRLLKQSVPGHYRVFTGAGRALWASQNPYGSDFGTHVGYYFYSPACAMTVFGPLSALPEKLGIVLFMALSWTLFVVGVRAFFRAFAHADSRSAGVLQWFWIAITAQMVGGILASKLEIAMSGVLLLSLAWLNEAAPKRGFRLYSAGILLAMILNWKFQPLPVAGLTLLSWVLIRREWRLPLVVVLGLAGFYLLPFAFFPSSLLLTAHATWQATFAHFIQEAYLDFENIFAFLHNGFGIPISFAGSQIVSGAVGAGLAIFIAVRILRDKLKLEQALLLSTALGAMFMTVFSPLGQNNALILYSPLLLAAFVCLNDSENPGARRHWTFWIAGTVCVMTFIYSDMVPLQMRESLRHLSLKPIACLMLGLAIALEAWSARGIFSRPSVLRPVP